MITYIVRIKEEHTAEFEVEADTLREAEDIAREK